MVEIVSKVVLHSVMYHQFYYTGHTENETYNNIVAFLYICHTCMQSSYMDPYILFLHAKGKLGSFVWRASVLNEDSSVEQNYIQKNIPSW